MKKIFAIIALAALTLVACEKVEQIETPAENVTTIRAIAGAGQTKATVNGFEVFWSENDIIAVADEDKNMVEFTLTSGAGGATGIFNGSLGGKALGDYAVYPKTDNASVSGNSVTVDYLTSWAYGKSEVPMWGANDGSGVYSFDNIGGAVLVSYSNVPTTDDAKTFVLTSTGEANITGTVTVSGLDGTPSVDITALSGKTVTITDIPGDKDVVSFVIPVPAGTYSFKAELLDGTTLVPGTNKTAANRTITVNKITKFPEVDLTPVITASPSSFNVASTGSTTNSITYSISNVAAGEVVTAASNVTWIESISVADGTVTFIVAANPYNSADNGAARSGEITLSYTGADDVVVTVNQDPAPVITVNTNPVYSVMNGGAGSISYSISDPTGATLTATPAQADTWLTGSSVANAVSGNISFTATAQATDAAPRTGTITLSYYGAEDVTVTVLQEGLIYTLNASTYGDWDYNHILNSSNPLHFGLQSNAETECYISSKSDIADGKNISRVEVSSGNTGSGGGGVTCTVNSLTITAHNTSASGTTIGNQSVTSGITGSTVTLANSGATTGTPWTGKYYKIAYVIKNSKSNKQGWVEFNNAKFYGYNVP